jgi:hypothetical protein
VSLCASHILKPQGRKIENLAGLSREQVISYVYEKNNLHHLCRHLESLTSHNKYEGASEDIYGIFIPMKQQKRFQEKSSSLAHI